MSIPNNEATTTTTKHKIDDRQVRLYLLNLQDKLRLIEATVYTSASALTHDDDKLMGDVAQVLYELASQKLDEEIKKLARLVKAWPHDEQTNEAPSREPLEERESA